MSIDILGHIRFFHKRLISCFVVALFQIVSSADAAPGDPAVSGLQGAGGRPIDVRALTAQLYATGAPPRWLDDGQAQARLALELLENATAHGLEPRHYGTDTLADRVDRPRISVADAAFERDLSAAMLQFLADLRVGRTDSPYRAPGTLTGFDLVEYLRSAVNDGRLAHAVDAAAPAIPLYRRVKDTLAQYRVLARLAPQWPTLPAVGPAGIVPGTPYAGAELLRERLRLLGDLNAEAPFESDPIYTARLAEAVRQFQSRHGLAEDGVLGPGTVAALSVSLTQRVEQLALTLERLRWLPRAQAGRIIAVNVPAYRLWAFDPRNGTGVQALEMRVIVGKAARTQTPLFIGQMRYLEFNPYWNVPRSIEVGEIIPKLARDPTYLQQNDMELVPVRGQAMSATGASALARIRSGTARVRQRPGSRNVLGAVKFAMPNPMNIYLHSTSSQELFNRARRDLSHGCIRVERPAELAQFVLADPVTWNADRVGAAMRPGPTRTVKLAEPVPVVLFYATAITDRNGRALFAEDIYRRDPPLLEALRAK